MGRLPDSRRRLRDKIEERSRHRRGSSVSKPAAIDPALNSTSDNTETRFAACVAFGMSKIQRAETIDVPAKDGDGARPGFKKRL